MQEMAVWHPAPHFDFEVMLAQETKGYKPSQAKNLLKLID